MDDTSGRELRQDAMEQILLDSLKRTPSDNYLKSANQPSLPQTPDNHRGHIPQLVILDLNGSLVLRSKPAVKHWEWELYLRPYLSSFLQYLFGYEEVDGEAKKRFRGMIWSSSSENNVARMLNLVGLSQGQSSPPLQAIWGRSTLDVPAHLFKEKYDVIKDMDKVWTAIPSSSQQNTILVDDTPAKSILQPYNVLSIPTFTNDTGDTHLLELIAALERLRYESNVSSALRDGQFGSLWNPDAIPGTSEKWVEEGLAVLQYYGIDAEPVFQKEWADCILSRQERRPENPAHFQAVINDEEARSTQLDSDKSPNLPASVKDQTEDEVRANPAFTATSQQQRLEEMRLQRIAQLANSGNEDESFQPLLPSSAGAARTLQQNNWNTSRVPLSPQANHISVHRSSVTFGNRQSQNKGKKGLENGKEGKKQQHIKKNPAISRNRRNLELEILELQDGQPEQVTGRDTEEAEQHTPEDTSMSKRKARKIGRQGPMRLAKKAAMASIGAEARLSQKERKRQAVQEDNDAESGNLAR